MSVLDWFRREPQKQQNEEPKQQCATERDPELKDAKEREDRVARQLRVIQLERAIQGARKHSTD